MADHGCHPSPAPWCVQPWQWGPLERTQLLTLNFSNKKKIITVKMPNTLPEKYDKSYTRLIIKNCITFAKKMIMENYFDVFFYIVGEQIGLLSDHI